MAETDYAQQIKSRVITVFDMIDDALANDVIAKMLFLQMEDKQKPVTLLIDSPGGSATAALAILDTMQFLSCPVHTQAASMAGGMALLILAGGEPGKRKAANHSKLMMCRSTGVTPNDTRAQQFLERLNQRISTNFSTFSKKSPQNILEDMKLERTYTPEGARLYGLIDEVLP